MTWAFLLFCKLGQTADHTPVSILGPMFRHLAEQASVPVVCHIDHATTVEECQLGIDYGFTSVMIDGSRLPLTENIALTSAVTDIAHPHGGVRWRRRSDLLGIIIVLCLYLLVQMRHLDWHAKLT